MCVYKQIGLVPLASTTTAAVTTTAAAAVTTTAAAAVTTTTAAAVSAAVTTAIAASVTTAFSPSTAAAVAAAATAGVTAAAATAATAAATATGFSLVDPDHATHPLDILKFVDGLGFLGISGKLNKRKTTLATRVPIEGQAALLQLPILGKQALEVFHFGIEGKITHVNCHERKTI